MTKENSKYVKKEDLKFSLLLILAGLFFIFIGIGMIIHSSKNISQQCEKHYYSNESHSGFDTVCPYPEIKILNNIYALGGVLVLSLGIGCWIGAWNCTFSD